MDKIDYDATYKNCITGISLEKAAVPMYFKNDREAIEVALGSIGLIPVEKINTSQVSEALRFKNDHYFIINQQIKVTKMHRFFTEDGWKRVRDLKIGDMLQKSDGTFEVIRSKELVFTKLTVYNLEIKNDHNFYVSFNGKSGYLVHNNGHGGGK